MKDKIIRLLKAIGIALLCCGIAFLIVWIVARHEDIAVIVLFILVFIFVVTIIYKDATL